MKDNKLISDRRSEVLRGDSGAARGTLWRRVERIGGHNRVTTRLGTSTAEMFRIFVAQIAHTGKVPLNLAPEPEAGLDRERRNRVLRDLDDSEGW